jgi:hypothetical protein
MVAPVDFVAVQAVLRNRRMFKCKRPPLFSMAIVAKIVYGIGLDHSPDVSRAHGIMAARTLDLALFDGMMRLFICLRPDIPVTSETEVRLCDFQVILSGHSGVDGMAVVTCDLH